MLSFNFLPKILVYFLAATLFPLIEANLATCALHSGVTFMYGPLFHSSFASATAFKTSLFASATDAVGK